MTSRESLRKQSQQPAAQPRKHWLTTLLGVVAGIVLLVCLLLNTTLLNENFVAQEVTRSSLGSQIQSEINDSFNSYGMSGEVISQKQTNRLLRTAIRQVYAGENIHLDVSDVVNNVENNASDALGGYSLPTTFSNSINDQVSSIVNSRINSSQLTNFESDIRIARHIVIAGLVISVTVLLCIAIYDLMTGTLLRDFRWICLLSGLLFWGVLRTARSAAVSTMANDSLWKPITSSIADDVLRQGNYFVIAMLILAVVIFAASLIRRHRA